MMSSKLTKKLQIFLFLLLSVVSFAQSVPPPPENPESGGIGGYPASPIDAHLFILFSIAVFLIGYVAVKARGKVLQ